MTKDDEARVLAMLDAFENGKRVADLDEVEPEKSVDAMIEVTDSDGESRRASLGTLLQATDAKERLDKTDESINTLTDKVDALVDSTTVRRWTSQKISNITLSTLSEDGVYYKTIPVAPMTSEDESRFHEAACLAADGQISRLLWDGDMYIPGSDEIRKGDVINGAYIATANAQTLQWGDRRYRIIEMADSNNNRYVLTSAPCSGLDHFVQISYQDFIDSGLGKVGLVVRIPGLFCTDQAQYIKDAGLMEVDYGNGCFVLVNYSGGRFSRWPNPIHFENDNPIYRTQKDGLEYKRCKGWTTARTTQNKMVKIDIEVSCGDTIGYRVGDNQRYTLFPFIGEDPESKLCRAGIRYVELPFAYAPSQVGEVAACTLSLEDDPLYGKYDERNIFLVIMKSLSGVKVPDCAFFPGSELKIRSENWNHPYSVNLKVIDRDADFMEKLCPTRLYDGMKPQSATFRAEVTFNDGTEKLEGTAEFRVLSYGSRIVNRAYSTANRPSTTLDVDTDAIEAGRFTLSSDLIGLKKVLRLWRTNWNYAEVTNDRLMTGMLSEGGKPVEVDGHEVYRVAYHPEYYMLPDVGIDGAVPRDNPEEGDYYAPQRQIELWKYNAGDYVEFVSSGGHASKESMLDVEELSGLIVLGHGASLMIDVNNAVAGFHSVPGYEIRKALERWGIIGHEWLPWSDASRDDGGQLKPVADISGFRGRVASLWEFSNDGETARWQMDMYDGDAGCITNHVAWPDDKVKLWNSHNEDVEPVTLTIVEVEPNSYSFTIEGPAGLDICGADDEGELLYNRFNIVRHDPNRVPQRWFSLQHPDRTEWMILKGAAPHVFVERREHPGSSEGFAGWHPGGPLINEAWNTGGSVEIHYFGRRIGASEAWAEVAASSCVLGYTGYYHSLGEIAKPRANNRGRIFDFTYMTPSSDSLAAVCIGDLVRLTPDDTGEIEVTEVALGDSTGNTDDQWQQLETYVIRGITTNGGWGCELFFYPDMAATPYNPEFPLQYKMEQR